jgi:hypothetical protein
MGTKKVSQALIESAKTDQGAFEELYQHVKNLARRWVLYYLNNLNRKLAQSIDPEPIIVDTMSILPKIVNGFDPAKGRWEQYLRRCFIHRLLELMKAEVKSRKVQNSEALVFVAAKPEQPIKLIDAFLICQKDDPEGAEVFALFHKLEEGDSKNYKKTALRCVRKKCKKPTKRILFLYDRFRKSLEKVLIDGDALDLPCPDPQPESP